MLPDSPLCPSQADVSSAVQKLLHSHCAFPAAQSQLISSTRALVGGGLGHWVSRMGASAPGLPLCERSLTACRQQRASFQLSPQQRDKADGQQSPPTDDLRHTNALAEPQQLDHAPLHQGMHNSSVADPCCSCCRLQVQEVNGEGPPSTSTVQRGLPVISAAAAEVFHGDVCIKVRHMGGLSLCSSIAV